ncbi:PKD domain-containing protein [Pseudonocardiaceae bacterium YIM PH 21723]|nr:PKD domain-containing protein [Pseudonocardiaceae bacterium YIM PH 21723]
MNRRAQWLALGLALVTGLIGAALTGYPENRVGLHTRSGTAWLASAGTGRLTLVDGVSGEPAAQVPVGRPDDGPLEVIRLAGASYAVRPTSGTVTRVDAATQRAGATVTPLGRTGSLRILPTDHQLYAVDTESGLVGRLDSHDLHAVNPAGKLVQAAAPDAVATDRAGRLWLLDQRSGELVWTREGHRGARPAAATAGHTLLHPAGAGVALLDRARGVAELLSRDGGVERSVRPQVGPQDAVTATGSPDSERLLLANSSRQSFQLCDLRAAQCAAPLPLTGTDLGAPVELREHVLVPDYASGRVWIIDLRSMRVLAERQLFDGPRRFELVVSNGIVFYNDPLGDQAGVLSLDGEVRQIAKYDRSAGALPVPDTTREPAPDPGRPDGQVMGPVPGPGSAPGRQPGSAGDADKLSIQLRPGDRGPAGMEFTLAATGAGSAEVRWDFADGGTATGHEVRHSWAAIGSFVVTARSGSATAQRTVTIEPAGKPEITRIERSIARPVFGQLVTFTANIAGGNPDSWEWTVRRTGSGAAEAPHRGSTFQHRFPEAGGYTVSLTVTVGGAKAESAEQFTVAQGRVNEWGPWSKDDQLPEVARSGVVQAAAGAGHLLLRKSDGSVVGLGKDAWGKDVPAALIPLEARHDAIDIAAAPGFSLVVRSDGRLFAWGENGKGQVNIPPGVDTDVQSVAVNQDYAMALKRDGSVHAWGGPYQTKATVPREAATGVIAIAAGTYFSMAVTSGGKVISWMAEDSAFPADFSGVTKVPEAATHDVVAVDTKHGAAFALTSGGSVIAWGDNEYGDLDIPEEIRRSRTIAIGMHGDNSNLALGADGVVRFWGRDSGQVKTVPERARTGVVAICNSSPQYISIT